MALKKNCFSIICFLFCKYWLPVRNIILSPALQLPPSTPSSCCLHLLSVLITSCFTLLVLWRDWHPEPLPFLTASPVLPAIPGRLSMAPTTRPVCLELNTFHSLLRSTGLHYACWRARPAADKQRALTFEDKTQHHSWSFLSRYRVLPRVHLQV